MAKIGEWFWRFLAAVMLFAVGWMMWIFHQLNLPPLFTNAAFEAAARASAKQSSHGVIAPAAAADPAPAAAPSLAPGKPKEPPINAEKLKFSDSIAGPAPDTK